MTCKGYANGCCCTSCASRSRRHNLQGISDKEVREFVAQNLTPAGFRRGELDGNGHHVFWHPSIPARICRIPNTPSDVRWKKNKLTELRRLYPHARFPERSGYKAQPAKESKKKPAVAATSTKPPTNIVDFAMWLAAKRDHDELDQIVA